MSTSKEKDDYLRMLRDNRNNADTVKGIHIAKELMIRDFVSERITMDGTDYLITDSGISFLDAGGFTEAEKRKNKKESSKRTKDTIIQIMIGLAIAAFTIFITKQCA